RHDHGIDGQVRPRGVACNLVVSLQTIISRKLDPTQTAVITVGTIHAGDAVNVIPEYAKLALSVRYLEPRIRDLLQERITKLARAVAEGHDA
ncbi:peptidase dimerization domain-containing protein, partial [Rhizobium johnstonii]|uniref:peptidase dimerization domain-containing protein n=1 Tax=Rhizobium johnstonii TaxID=3019933 RepID=UPI003F9ACB94